MPLVVYSGVPGAHHPVHMAVVNESELSGAVVTGDNRLRGQDRHRHRGDADDAHADSLVDILVTFAYFSFFGTSFVAVAFAATMASLFLLCPGGLVATADFV